eukprot:3525878-Amphidinium_carterae.1
MKARPKNSPVELQRNISCINQANTMFYVSVTLCSHWAHLSAAGSFGSTLRMYIVSARVAKGNPSSKSILPFIKGNVALQDTLLPTHKQGTHVTHHMVLTKQPALG